jgi:predicted DNA-binding transcriptional regulator AlpA
MAKNPQGESAKPRKAEDVVREVSANSFDSAPIMMTADELAETLCISKRQVWRLKSKGDIPKPVTIARSVRWRRADILQWIEAGCPSCSSLLNTLIYNLILRPIYALFLRN